MVDEITAGLGETGSAVLGQLIAAGNGGVAKTQLAASVFNSATGRDLRVWVSATARDAIVAAYADAAHKIGVATPAEVTAEDAATRFREWLATTDKACLVVLDDITNEADIAGLVPHGPAGAVLVTTRLRHLRIGRARHIDIDVFTPSESVSYLTESLSQPSEGTSPGVVDQAAELADDLGHLPLALAHAVAVVAFDGITCADYRHRFADRTTALAELIPQQPPDDYTHTIATTWALALDRANTMAPVGLTQPALELAALPTTRDGTGGRGPTGVEIPDRALTDP